MTPAILLNLQRATEAGGTPSASMLQPHNVLDRTAAPIKRNEAIPPALPASLLSSSRNRTEGTHLQPLLMQDSQSGNSPWIPGDWPHGCKARGPRQLN